MLVPPGLRKCVAYLVVDHADEARGAVVREPGGTVFFVAVTDDEEGQAVYAVTASHVVNATREYSGAFLRLNKSEGGYADVPLPTADDWTMHHATDVAAVRVYVSGEDFDLAAISSSLLMPDEAAVNFNTQSPRSSGHRVGSTRSRIRADDPEELLPPDWESGRQRYLRINWVHFVTTWAAFALLLLLWSCSQRRFPRVRRTRW